jgi:phosphoesterase RecJ-like protein
MKREILDAIKEYNTIIIHRHISPDPDAIGSQAGLAEIIKATYMEKHVYVVGAQVDRLSYLYDMDKVKDDMYDGALCIVTDTANQPRVDDSRFNRADKLIKIDHHPLMDSYGDIEWVDTKASSTCEMIMDFYAEFRNELVLTKKARELLFAGIVADTGRFMYPSTTTYTYELVSELIEKDLSTHDVYSAMYARPLSEVRLQGYISENLIVTENKLGYIKISNDIIEKYGVEVASASNMVGLFNNINEVLVWVFFTEDVARKQIRCNIRSRGPVINEIAFDFGGGGHPMASGVRFKTFDETDPLIDALDDVCRDFQEK